LELGECVPDFSQHGSVQDLLLVIVELGALEVQRFLLLNKFAQGQGFRNL
jgi:hypothetical protein